MMESTQQNVLSSHGSGEPISPTVESEAENRGEVFSAKSGQSTKSKKFSQDKQNSSLITPEESLGIWQDALLVLRQLGGQFKVFELPKLGNTVIVFENIGFRDGDFFFKSSPAPATTLDLSEKL